MELIKLPICSCNYCSAAVDVMSALFTFNFHRHPPPPFFFLLVLTEWFPNIDSVQQVCLYTEARPFICLFKEQVTVPILKMGKSMYIFTYIFVPLYQGKKNYLDTF